MKFRVIHTTEYEYSDAANVCHNIAHLSPRLDARQTCNSHFLSVVPQPTVLDERVDHFGNRIFYFSIEKPHKSMIVTATSMMESIQAMNNLTHSISTCKQFESDMAAMPPAEEAVIREFVLESPMVPQIPELYEFAQPSFAAHETIQQAAADLMRRIHDEFKYDPTFTTLATPIKDVVQHRRGVCQDFAHLAIGSLRAFGLAARYVSGYLETDAPAGKEKLVGADASHAWLDVFIPDVGWYGIDPTNNQQPDQRYITLGWGRDYADIAPLKGVVFGGGTHRMTVSVNVERLK